MQSPLACELRFSQFLFPLWSSARVRELREPFRALSSIRPATPFLDHGISIALNRRLADEVEFSGSYTFSKTLDDASDFAQQPQNPYDVRAERSVSANDQRHRFVFSGTFDPFGDEEEGKKPTGILPKLFGNIETAPILTIGSGRPVNPLVGSDANRNGEFPLSSRLFGFPRNALRTGNQVQLDLRILKYFIVGEHGKLALVAESFNLLNHTNVIGLNQVFGPGAVPIPIYNTLERASLARQFQFSIDLSFDPSTETHLQGAIHVLKVRHCDFS